MSADFLQTMKLGSRARADQARATLPLSELMAQCASVPRPPVLQLSARGFDIIAEVKLRSPAMGSLHAAQTGERQQSMVAERVRRYAAAGAAAISVLTEPSRFDGSMQHLQWACEALRVPPALAVPVMRKDFLVDPYQVYEARRAGAGGVLVIVRMLSAAELDALLQAASQLDMFVLLEAFDEQDLTICDRLLSQYGAQMTLLVGVNCRDLTSLQVVPQRLEQMVTAMSRAAPRVAESGLESAADAARLSAAGYSMALVGGALMRTADPEQLVAQMLIAGRRS